jgi:hypothetical protein
VTEIALPTLDPSMTDDEIIAAFGGRDAAMAVYKQAQYLHEQPAVCRDHLIELARYLMPDPNHPMDSEHSRYHVAKHHKLIAEAFERVLAGKCLRLILSVPPQHGKSQLAKDFLAAHQGRYPWKHVMMGTYNQDFANEYGDDVRNIIKSARSTSASTPTRSSARARRRRTTW